MGGATKRRQLVLLMAELLTVLPPHGSVFNAGDLRPSALGYQLTGRASRNVHVPFRISGRGR
jgi:hypothetical protein